MDKEPLLAAQSNGSSMLLDSLGQDQQPLPVNTDLFNLPWVANVNPFAPQDTSLGTSPLSRPWSAGLTLDVAAAAAAAAAAASATGSAPAPNRNPDSATTASIDLTSAGVASAASSRQSFGACFSAASTRAGSSLSSLASLRSTSPRFRDSKSAMSRRPAPKRPVDSEESSGEESPVGAASNAGQAAGKMKLPRLERRRESFSTVVKNRLQSYTRTGQACDRCKVRKIRCDALPEGCSHCINLNLKCYVTDRVTGRTERRGYMQELEREKNGMLSHIRQLEQLLEQNRIAFKPYQQDSVKSESVDPEDNTEEPTATTQDHTDPEDEKKLAKQSSPKPNFTPSFPRSKLESRSDARGTVAGRAAASISSVRGTRLSIFGTTIDTTSFPAPDVDEPEDPNVTAPLYNKSVQAFLQSAHGVNPPLQVNLPSREDAFTYAEWFFMTVAIYLPLLHKPSFMKMLGRMYDDPDFKPTVPELVCVHMVFANIYFQCGVRNWQQADQRSHLNDLSNKHYHFAISKMYDLQCSRDLLAVQCLALIAAHTRQFPKPGAGAIVAHLALQRAIDFNLHRNVELHGKETNLGNELRKRTWWVILIVLVAITGRRGYPVPIAVEEFDVDFPEPIADELLLEDGVDKSRSLPCPYEAGLACFRITPIFMEVYSNMYSVRGDPNNYVSVVYALEDQLKQWEDDLPASLKLTDGAELDHRRLAALFMRSFALEVRLSLRHPSVAMTTDKKMLAENTKICAETARETLGVMQELQLMRCLDTTWYSMSVCAGCIFSMLMAQWERRFDITPGGLAELKKDMKSWTSILHELSVLLDSGLGISSEIEGIMDKTLKWIEHDMQQMDTPKKPGSQVKAVKGKQSNPQQPLQRTQPQATLQQEPQSIPQPQQQPRQYELSPHSRHARQETSQTPDLTPQVPAADYSAHAMAGHATYPAMPYGDTQQASMAHSSYQTTPDIYYNGAGNAVSVPQTSVQANPLMAFASHATQPMPAHSAADYMWQGRGTTWQDWAAAVQDSEERYSANTLLTLGAGPQRSHTMDSSLMMDASLQNHNGEVPNEQGSQWPMVMFDPHSTTTG